MRKWLFALLALIVLAAAPASAQQGTYYEARPFLAQAADFTAYGTATYLGGWSIRESAGTAAVATVIIRNGGDTDTGTGGVQCAASGGVTQVGGQALAFIELSANGSAGENYAVPISAGNGVCADVVAGTVDATFYFVK